MRIDPGTMAHRYQAFASRRSSAEITAAKQELASKTDKISINAQAAPRGDFDRQLKNITAEIEASASPARLQALQEKIENNEYHIPARDIANAMLGFARA